MISILFLVVAAAAVLSVYTVIGRLAIPPEDRVPLRELGWDGWGHTLRRSLVFLGDCAPSDGDRSRPAPRTSSPMGGQAGETPAGPGNARPMPGAHRWHD